MKRLFVLVLCALSVQFLTTYQTECFGNESMSEAVSTVYEISGVTSIQFSGESVGSTYIVEPTPSGATYEWRIVGGNGRCFVYPNGAACAINIYERGGYRLSCVITFSDGTKTESATYITVY